MPRGKIILALIMIFSLNMPAFCSDNKPWVFFDLGYTLLSHDERHNNMKYIPQATEYLQTLKDHGFHLGLLVNWPESEGNNDGEKLILMDNFLNDRWTGKIPLNLDIFEVAHFPPTGDLYKPHPHLFKKALKIAGHCNAIYYSENGRETRSASGVGLLAFKVNFFPDNPSKYKGFLSMEEILNEINECLNEKNDGGIRNVFENPKNKTIDNRETTADIPEIWICPAPFCNVADEMDQ
ncbi:MAG: hypothetical protein KAI33_07960 [Elusimicrobiales bacterium]|nr:hypothetical protein [Elusimicrobiales bacterium]